MTVKGCSTEDILYLEENYGELPKSYKLFLSLLGVESGDFKEGTDLLFKDINDINKYTVELMQENNISIPDGMYSFYCIKDILRCFLLKEMMTLLYIAIQKGRR